ncbi:MAG: hypothetical protein Q8L86_20435 [Vicinamibacterales bacterium]|nr:hypothetical protein [Vicinamibacterales bacterium]
MTEPTIRVLGLIGSAAYAALIGWLYLSQPQTMAQVAGGLAATVGAYHIDQAAFSEGLRLFHEDRFVEARAAFARADGAVRDARTQFYVAYSYYRQGWHRLYHDDALLTEGLAAVDRALALAPAGHLVVEDPGLSLQSADALKAEIEAGLSRDWSDLNPLRLFRERR